ncbi:MAG: hypothetical protein CMH18_11475 [Methylophaga sp.]|uniref:gp53-like domain-containing protein n=1 Tax=Methylophaga sp. TaxID=2024840 RepID=UPI000C94BFCE|nr:hypothetical protein [Methylophaga sp.]MAL50370.1 hypothetical protein [Methylophaga sp.]|tara:strand:- start:194 stop:2371 length:2178 start_codon:yes stop_codon:yes gene_type:complete
MAILSKGTDFATGEQVTAARLDALVDNATFASGAVDGSTTELNGSGAIIVKDAGITSAKLNLSATGVSQTIASFKTTQDGNNRSLDILTPASTTDLDSPFELATGNAILFQIDPDHPILFDANGKVGIGTEGPDEQLTVQAGTFGNNQDGGIAVQLGAESGSHFKTAFKCKTDGSGNPRTAIDAPLSSTGGTTQEAISIDNAGKVGIGNTDPSSILDITQATGVAEINLNATANDAILSLNSDTDEGQDSEIHFNAGANTRGKIEYNHHVDAASQKMSFFAGDNSERLTILGDGKVGIGATSPTQELEVAGDITTNSIIAREGATDDCLRLLSDPEAPDGTNGGSQIQLFAQEASTASQIYHSARFHVFNPLSGSAVFQINSDASISHFNGSVGVGTSSPSKLLHIKSSNSDTAESVACFGNGDIDRGLEIKTNGNGGTSLDWGFNAVNSRNLVFDTNQTERMRISSSGNVGIGDTDPSKELVVKNAATTSTESVINVISGNQGVAGLYLGDSDDDIVGGIVYDNNTDLLQLRSSNNQTAVSINSSENVGIGTTSPSSKLDVNGNTNVTGNLDVSGDIDVDGTIEFDALSGTGSVSVTDIKDEDNMSSNSATALATQQSIRAFTAMSPIQNGSGGGYTGGESVTFPNGLILKMGKTGDVAQDGDTTVTFGSAFPNEIISLVITKEGAKNIGGNGEITASSVSASGFVFNNGADSTGKCNYMAMGR